MQSLPTLFPINLFLTHTRKWRSMEYSALKSGKKHFPEIQLINAAGNTKYRKEISATHLHILHR